MKFQSLRFIYVKQTRYYILTFPIVRIFIHTDIPTHKIDKYINKNKKRKEECERSENQWPIIYIQGIITFYEQLPRNIRFFLA